MSLNTTAKTVRKRGEVTILALNRKKAYIITARGLPGLGKLRGLHLYKKRISHSNNPRYRAREDEHP